MKNAELWKRVLHSGIKVVSPDWTPLMSEQHQQAIMKAEIIVDSRPRDELAELGMAWRWQRYKGVTSPFGRFWVEGTTLNPGGELDLWGVLFESSQTGEIKRLDGERIFRANFFASGKRANGLVGCMGWMIINLDNDDLFALKGYSLGGGRLGWVPQVCSQFDPENVAIHTILDNALDTLYLLSCNNVGLAARETDPSQVKIATKRHGPRNTNYRYHVLVVRPPGAKPDHPGEEIGTMPRHVCRGHFREYSVDRPLFGRAGLFGRFFIPPHMKGDKKNGIVEKDYEVRASA